MSEDFDDDSYVGVIKIKDDHDAMWKLISSGAKRPKVESLGTIGSPVTFWYFRDSEKDKRCGSKSGCEIHKLILEALQKTDETLERRGDIFSQLGGDHPHRHRIAGVVVHLAENGGPRLDQGWPRRWGQTSLRMGGIFRRATSMAIGGLG